MKSSSPTSLALWVGALLLAIGSLVFGYFQLDGLPDPGVQFGPDLTVRSVSVDRESGAERQEFKRGDRLVAVQGQSVEDLRDLRTVLQNLPEPAKSPETDAKAGVPDAQPARGEAKAEEQERTATYQLVRPLHRFPIALQGELKDPTALPPGVEPTDRLVELDGRPLQTKVGPEAVRSIVASRPEALLVFERKNAVFSGTMNVPESEPPYGVVGAFGLVALVLIGLWWFRSRDLEPGAVVAISLETVCIGWIALLAFEYQWTLSDYGLTAAVIAGFALVRPFAFFARNIGSGYGTPSGWLSVLVGLVATGSVLGLLFGGYFASAEQALHVAALIAGLFVVYEIFLASIDDSGPVSTLGEGTGYLAWILVLALFSALLAWYLAPISFEENRWRWFSAVIVGLVWFGDVLFCFRGPGVSGYAAIAHRDDRRSVVREYLEQVRELVSGTNPFFVVATRDESVLLEVRGGSLRTIPSSEALHDAVSILIQEGVRIPLPGNINRQAHPMGGIAKTMDMALAVRMGAPDGGIQIDGVDLVLVGIEESPTSELPVHPSDETLDELRHLLTGDVWTSAIVEALPELRRPQERPEATSKPQSDEASADASAMNDAEVAKLQAEVEDLREQLREASKSEPEVQRAAKVITEQPDVTDESVEEPTSEPDDEPAEDPAEEPVSEPSEAPAAPAATPLAPPPTNFEELLEPELVDALHYLLDSNEPIVLAGASGAGKTFTARCANDIDADRELVAYDAGEDDEDAHTLALFGRVDEEGNGGLASQCEGGALLIRAAGQLSDTILLRLCQAAEIGQIRLYLAFDAEDAEERSVVADRSTEVRELLEHRELIIPRIAHRPTILEAVLEHFLREYASASDDEAPADFSEQALDALRDYDFPGQVGEARAVVEEAAGQAEGATVELADLPERVR